MIENPTPKAITIWLTGLSGSGKTTLANALGEKLKEKNINYLCIDGDVLRDGLCNDLGFTDADRKENMRRAANLAKMVNDQNQFALVSLISPFNRDRELAKKIIGKENFIEIYVECSFEECARRDVKGLYKKANNGDLINFTGKDSRYEAPESPAVHLRTDLLDSNSCVQLVFDEIQKRIHQLTT
jgi:adenylyl-sulfate kinase